MPLPWVSIFFLLFIAFFSVSLFMSFYSVPFLVSPKKVKHGCILLVW